VLFVDSNAIGPLFTLDWNDSVFAPGHLFYTAESIRSASSIGALV